MPDAMVQDQNLLEELAALRRHLHRFDSQFPRKTIPPAPPWNPGFFFKLRHDPKRMNREHIAADHYNCHRDGVFANCKKRPRSITPEILIRTNSNGLKHG